MIFILGIVLVSGRAVIIGLLALIEKLRPDHAVMPDPPPSVTVLIPAHNEENVIVQTRSEEHTSELQSRSDLVCRLLLEKKKKTASKCQPQLPWQTQPTTPLQSA